MYLSGVVWKKLGLRRLKFGYSSSCNKEHKTVSGLFFIILATIGKTCIRSNFPKKNVKSKMQFDIEREALNKWANIAYTFFESGKEELSNPSSYFQRNVPRN